MRAKLEAHKGQIPKPQGFTNKGTMPGNLPNPNAMDTSADRSRAQLAGSEEIDYTQPPYSPPNRGRGRGGRPNGRDITCYNCGKKGHISRNCYQARGQGQNSQGRSTDTEPVTIRSTISGMTDEEQAQYWMSQVAELGDGAKDRILKDLWTKEGFQDA